MIEEKSAGPTDGDISPYLQQPLRTLETARQDQKRRQREAAEAKQGRNRRTDSPA